MGRRSRDVMIPALISSPSSSVAGVCGKDEESVRRKAEPWPELEVHKDLGALLDNDKVDVIYISTPHFLHVPQAVQAIEAGKHVLMESPMALSADGANKLVEKARHQGVLLGVVFNFRFHSAMAELKRRLEDGEIGEVRYIASDLAEPVDFDSAWWGDSQRAGPAALLRLGVHGIDAACWLKRMGVREVICMGGEEAEEGINIVSTSVMRFEDGTMAQTMGATYFSEPDHRIVVEGDQGRIVVEGDLTGAGEASLRLCRDGEVERKVFEPEDPVGKMIDAFTEAARGGKDFSPDGSEGKTVVEVTCAAIESMRTKKAHRVGEVPRMSG